MGYGIEFARRVRVQGTDVTFDGYRLNPLQDGEWEYFHGVMKERRKEIPFTIRVYHDHKNNMVRYEGAIPDRNKDFGIAIRHYGLAFEQAIRDQERLRYLLNETDKVVRGNLWKRWLSHHE